ncbi:hypothetical protein Tco_1414567 [Tanacetum coccineum]
MVATAQNTNNTTIRSILQQDKLTGPNFTNWFQNLRIVLKSEGKLVHLEQPIAPLPYLVASQAARDAYEALYDAQNEVACLMLVKQELFETVKAFHACKQEDGQSVSSYLLKMKSYLDNLECLGYEMPNELRVSLILNSLNKNYDQFVQNYNMHSMGKTLAKLHAMLKLHEKGIPRKAETPAVLSIRKGQRVRLRERISLLMLSRSRSHCHLREIIRQMTLSATIARRLVTRGGIVLIGSIII